MTTLLWLTLLVTSQLTCSKTILANSGFTTGVQEQSAPWLHKNSYLSWRKTKSTGVLCNYYSHTRRRFHRNRLIRLAYTRVTRPNRCHQVCNSIRCFQQTLPRASLSQWTLKCKEWVSTRWMWTNSSKWTSFRSAAQSSTFCWMANHLWASKIYSNTKRANFNWMQRYKMQWTDFSMHSSWRCCWWPCWRGIQRRGLALKMFLSPGYSLARRTSGWSFGTSRWHSAREVFCRQIWE